MKIIIVGAGKVGEYLFTDLNTEDNDIILIEKKQDILNEMLSKYDIMGISGSGTNLQAIIDGIKEKKINGNIKLVFSNRKNAYGELTHHGRWFNTTGKNTEKFLNNLYYLDTINFAKNLKCSVLFGITNLDKDCPKDTQEKIYNEITSRKKSCIYKKYYHENIPNFNDKIVSFLLEVE